MIAEGKNAAVFVTGDPISITDEATTTTDNTTYQITNEAKRVLDAETPMVVKVNGIAGSTGFKVNLALGKVIFDNPRSPADVVTVSGAYLPKSMAVTAHEFSFGKAVDIADVPRFREDYKRKLVMQKYAYGTISQWDVTDTFFTDALLSATPKYVVFDSGEDGAETKAALVFFEKDEIKAAVGSPQDAAVSFISADENVS